MARCDVVDPVAVGEGIAPETLVPLPAEDPGARGAVRRYCGDTGDKLSARPDGGKIHRAGRVIKVQQVSVCVDESGQHQSLPDVDDLGIAREQRDRLAGTDGGDPAVADRQRVDPRPVRVPRRVG